MRPLNWSVVCGASHSRCAAAACPNVYANAGSGLPEPMAVSKTCRLGYGTNRCVCIIFGILFCILSLSNLTDSLIALTRDLRHCSNKRCGMLLPWRAAVRTARRSSTSWATHWVTLSLPQVVSLANHLSVHLSCHWKREKSGSALPPRFKRVDLLIAAIAVTHGLVLVTNNREFRRVRGLPVEDWTVAFAAET